MRILFVAAYYKPAYVYGGPTRSISTLCEGLVGAGAHVTVLTTNANGKARLKISLGRALDVDGVQVWYYPLDLGGLYFYSPTLAATVRRRVPEFDLVVAETLWDHALIPTASACTRARVPFILPTRGQLQPWALKHKALKKQVYLALVGRSAINRASAIHCTDATEKDGVIRQGLHPPVFVVPNGIDTARFAQLPPRGGLRSRLGISCSAIQLLFLGRLTEIKRPDIAVGTLGALRAAGHDAHLVLAGPDEGHLMAKLQEQAAGLGCAAQIHFAGLLNEKETLQALADADLLMMPSEIQENFGMAALEAMAAGVPVLASEGVPVGRWASTAGAGVVVLCSNNDFRIAALELLSYPERLRAMGQAGQALARRRFDVDVVAREMLAQYEAIVETGRPLPERS